MTSFEHLTLQEIDQASAFDALSPIKGPEQPYRYPVHKDEDLGFLTTSISNLGDRAIVFRTWGLMDNGEYYGRKFTFKEYMKTANYFSGVFWFIVLNLLVILPFFTPLRYLPLIDVDNTTVLTASTRWFAKRFFHPGVGEGPSEELVSSSPHSLFKLTCMRRARRNYRAEWRGVAKADDGSATPRKAFVRVQSTADPYTLTAICMVQTANSILFSKDTLASKLGGGILTPATVASPELFKLLDRAGLKIEARII